MNRSLPPFFPPSRPQQQEPTFKAYWDKQEKWLDSYQKYMLEYIGQLVDLANTGAQGFSLDNVVAAGTISISAYTTVVTGTTTVSTIQTSPGFSGQIHIIAQDGFSTDTLGNIASAVAIPAGGSCLFDYNPVTAKWYPNLGD